MELPALLAAVAVIFCFSAWGLQACLSIINAYWNRILTLCKWLWTFLLYACLAITVHRAWTKLGITVEQVETYRQGCMFMLHRAVDLFYYTRLPVATAPVVVVTQTENSAPQEQSLLGAFTRLFL